MVSLLDLELDGGVVEVVDRFRCLRSLFEAHGGAAGQVSCRIAQASEAFGSLLTQELVSKWYSFHR